MKFFATTLALMSFAAFADVDYSRCNSMMLGTPINNDGQLQLWQTQKIVSKTTEGNKEKYVIDTNLGAYGGASKDSSFKQEITLERDEQGHVVKVITGGDKIDKKTVEAYKKMQIQMQVSGAVAGTGYNPYSMYGGGFGGGGYMPGLTEQTYLLRDKNGKMYYKRLSELDKEERVQVGMTEDLWKEMKQKYKRDKKSAAKIEKGLKELNEKSTPVFYIGQQSEFEIKDGVCTPKATATRMYNSKDNTVQTQTTFTKEACEEVEKLHLKHKEKIAKCDENNQEVMKDMGQNYEKLKDLSGGYGMFGGMGMGGMIGGMGFNPYGLQQSQLTTMKNYCEMMLNGSQFGFGQMKPKETGKTDASKQ